MSEFSVHHLKDAKSERLIRVNLLHNLLEQKVLNITLWSFDDNKVLKNCQLDMLIFDQVYKTIDKNSGIL